MFAILAAPSAQAQTLTVLHVFLGAGMGSTPEAGVTIDAAGNLYGSTSIGGGGSGCGGGCGTVFKLSYNGFGLDF